jgi:hypothetical protein
MRVFLNDNYASGNVDVYFIVGDGRDRRLLVQEQRVGERPSADALGWYERELTETGGWGDASVSLPVDVVGPLLEALNRSRSLGAVPVADELADVRDVRDRMIGMVERIVDADLAREAKLNGS